MLDIDWFAQHLDYQGFVSECQNIFGKDAVLAFEYGGDGVQEFRQKLGLATTHDNPSPRYNQTLNNMSVALLRTMNQYAISAKDKERLMPHLREINTILESYDKASLINEASRTKVLSLAKPLSFYPPV